MFLNVATGVLLLEQRVVLHSKHLWGFPDVGRVWKWVLSLNGKGGMWLGAANSWILQSMWVKCIYTVPFRSKLKGKGKVKNIKNLGSISVKDSRIWHNWSHPQYTYSSALPWAFVCTRCISVHAYVLQKSMNLNPVAEIKYMFKLFLP